MMKALRGNLAILALAPALVMLVLGLAVLRPAQARDAFLKMELAEIAATGAIPGLAVVTAPQDISGETAPVPSHKPQTVVCKILLCTGIMGFPVQEPPLRSSVLAGKLPCGPAPVPEEALARQDDPPPKSRSSIFS